MSRLRRLLHPGSDEEDDALTGRSAREDCLRLRHRLQQPLSVLHEHVWHPPTSPLGKHTKSTPFGSIDNPIHPLSIAIGCEGAFVARSIDVNIKHLGQTLRRAAELDPSLVDEHPLRRRGDARKVVPTSGDPERTCNR